MSSNKINSKKTNEPKIIVSEYPLNQILYGPPGTGKTYCTVREAVRICDGEIPDVDETVNRRFRELRDEGRIEFITFHQSYGYEEFVEGIRPRIVKIETGQNIVDYAVEPGVFQNICSLASKSSAKPLRQFTFNPDKQHTWKMSLGDTSDPEQSEVYSDCMENGRIRLGYGGSSDFTGCNTEEEILKRRKERETNVREFEVTAVHRLKNRMQTGDLVIVSDGNHKFRAIGRITGPYKLLELDDYRQSRGVEWLLELENSLPVERIMNKRFSQATIYELKPRVLKSDLIAQLLSGEEAETLPHVLIIDEINRGNISKIFGELITLIEPDKRLGEKNELKVTLPYSLDDFGVPSNLFLLGTMNTADRSIAFLDTALRRRFQFKEMLPDSRVINQLVGEGGVVEDVDVGSLLDAINKRIEYLNDREHQIGHAYFLGIKTLGDLRDVFINQIIPLLKEYFYDDWLKICQVLACPYDREGRALSKNAFPMIIVENLKMDLGDYGGGYGDSKLRYLINPNIIDSNINLTDCFDSISAASLVEVNEMEYPETE